MSKEEKKQFIDIEKKRLKSLYPHFSAKTINSMAQDEWKANDGCGNGITNRFSTLNYEAIKALIERIPQHDLSQYDDIHAVLKKKQCVYCLKSVKNASKKKGDHIFPVQANSSKPILTNFAALQLPCCHDCNGTRKKVPYMDFIMSDSKYQTNIQFFNRIGEITTANVKHYRADEAKFKEAKDYIINALYTYREMIQNIPIYEL